MCIELNRSVSATDKGGSRRGWGHAPPSLAECTKMRHFGIKIQKKFWGGAQPPSPDPHRWRGVPHSLNLTLLAPHSSTLIRPCPQNSLA